jgi:glycosyltransferase involved in cell wall biosynthesis
MENKSEQSKPVIMQILPALESGGVERGAIDIAKALKKADFEPIVVSNGGILVYQLNEAKIKHITLRVNSKNPLTIFSNIRKIVELIKENNVDIVHVRSRAPMWSAYFACKETGTKLVSTVHGTYSLNFLFWKVFPLKKIYNSIMLQADSIIVVSQFIKEYLGQNYQDKNKSFPAEKITVIQRGVELDYFNFEKVSKTRIIDLSKKWNLPDDKKIILMPARFTEWKGHEFLIEALTKVKNNFLCVLVGSDHGHKKFRKKIENKIVKNNLEGKVKVVGICKDMPSAYAISNVVICPSVKPEAFGRIAIEAQATSRIIISTKIGGSLETIIDGKTGFLVEVGESQKLAELIDQVLNFSDEKAQEIGIAARKNVEEKFSNQKMCDDTIKVYRSLASN